MENLTTRFKVNAVGLMEEIDAVSFQDAAMQALKKWGFISVLSITVDDQHEGAIEFLNCQIVKDNLTYKKYAVHNLYDESEETVQRLEFYASVSPSEVYRGIKIYVWEDTENPVLGVDFDWYGRLQTAQEEEWENPTLENKLRAARGAIDLLIELERQGMVDDQGYLKGSHHA